MPDEPQRNSVARAGDHMAIYSRFVPVLAG